MLIGSYHPIDDTARATVYRFSHEARQAGQGAMLDLAMNRSPLRLPTGRPRGVLERFKCDRRAHARPRLIDADTAAALSSFGAGGVTGCMQTGGREVGSEKRMAGTPRVGWHLTGAKVIVVINQCARVISPHHPGQPFYPTGHVPRPLLSPSITR